MPTELTLPSLDTDECFNSTVCGPDSVCTNTPGAYTCACQPGYAQTQPEQEPSGTNICIGICTDCFQMPEALQHLGADGKLQIRRQIVFFVTEVKSHTQSRPLYCFTCVSCNWQMSMSASEMLPSVVLMPTAQTQSDLISAPASLVIG